MLARAYQGHPGLCGWLPGSCTNSVRLDYRAVAGFGGLVATWVAGGLLAGLLGLFPGLGGPLRAVPGWYRALARPE